MKSKTLLLALTVSASALLFSCNNGDGCDDCVAADVDGYNEQALTDVRANHPEDFQGSKQVENVLKGSSHIALTL